MGHNVPFQFVLESIREILRFVVGEDHAQLQTLVFVAIPPSTLEINVKTHTAMVSNPIIQEFAVEREHVRIMIVAIVLPIILVLIAQCGVALERHKILQVFVPMEMVLVPE